MPKTRISILPLIAVLLVGCGKPRIDRISPSTKVLAFGDSLTFGVGAEKDESYPYILEKRIGCSVRNAGVSGEDTTTGLKRLKGELSRYTPDLVILCFGGNDMLRDQPRDLTISNLRKMIELVKDSEMDLILVGVPEPTIMLKVPDFYENLSVEYNIPYEGEVLRRVLSKSSLKSDHIHPNSKGYNMIAEEILRLIESSEK